MNGDITEPDDPYEIEFTSGNISDDEKYIKVKAGKKAFRGDGIEVVEVLEKSKAEMARHSPFANRKLSEVFKYDES